MMSTLEQVDEFEDLGRDGIRDFLTRMTNDYPKKIRKSGHSFYLIKKHHKPKKMKKRKRSPAKLNDHEQFGKPPPSQKRRLSSKKHR